MNSRLPGRPVDPFPFTSITPAPPPGEPKRSPWLLRITVIWLLLAALGYIALRRTANNPEPAEAAPHIAPAASVADIEDSLHHLDSVMDKTTIASASIRRVEVEVNRVLPVVEKNSLLVEKRRLESALAILDATRRDLEQGRQDLETVHSQLEEEKQKK